jgi:hypothetical protein
MRGILLLLGVLAVSQAAAQDNPACAKFEDPLAYNACLAHQGPTARAVRMQVAPPRFAPSVRAPPRRAGGRIVAKNRGKRGEMVFTVGK